MDDFIASLTNPCPECEGGTLDHGRCRYNYQCKGGRVLSERGRALLVFLSDFIEVNVSPSDWKGTVEIDG